ncbi:universal stress protein [Streptomyces meridianus]|uniref:Universal stress protein n=1 Tax=Streptomyces meridianus TaxID=2938945 RepID=A0ABT0XBH6_9ACTN|nr:universal stress protein [Streptomyces meridianus]MCM2579764.1 universal stress protein [Streptomyces meridianus]
MEPAITVGLDGSEESLSAARWAAREAELRGLPLRLMHARAPFTPEPRARGTEADWQAWSEHMLETARVAVRGVVPDLPVTSELVADEPKGALLEAAARSEILAIGSQGLARAPSYFLGDVGLSVMARADGRLVLVRAELEGVERPGTVADVVVGLSVHRPDALLEFAFDTAARHGAKLRAVQASRLPTHVYTPWGSDHVVVEEAVDDMRQELAGALRPWRERFPSVRVEEELRAESPGRAIVRASEGALLLAVGRRRHPGALRPRIGPVLQAAVHHAGCPVAVVPHD